LRGAKNLRDRRAAVERVLRQQQRGQQLAEEVAKHGKQVAGLSNLASVIISLLPWLIFWIRVRVLVPGLGRQFHWFIRQPFMTPTLSSGRFLGFATRLAVRPRTDNDRRQA